MSRLDWQVLGVVAALSVSAAGLLGVAARLRRLDRLTG